MSHQRVCGIYIHDVVKPILEYFTQMKQQMKNNEAQLELKNNEIEQLEKKDNKLQSDMKSMNTQLTELEKKQTDLREEMENKTVEITDLEDNIIVLEAELESTKTQNRQFMENESRFKKEIENKNKQIEELQKKIQSINCENNTANNDDQNKKLLENLAKCENQMNTQQEILHKNEQQISDLIELLNRSKANGLENANSCISFTDSEVHNIALDTIQVQCNSDIAGPGWTVIKQKIPGNFSFNENWSSYQSGFGYFDDNFFLGLEKMYRLTNMQPHELYIHMRTTNGGTYFARYDSFAISNAHDQYKIIELGNFSGNTKDFMSAFKNMPFSTYDRDNDQSSKENCASIRESGWWYKDCGFR